MDAGGNEERRKLDSLRMEYQKQKETPYEVLVYESLKQKILSGGYAAGEKIPEQSVSEELGVSRSPLRSAIRRLASEHRKPHEDDGLRIEIAVKICVIDVAKQHRRNEDSEAELIHRGKALVRDHTAAAQPIAEQHQQKQRQDRVQAE